MSVPTDKREEGKLGVLDAIRVLSSYTYNRLESRCIPKQQRWLYSYPIAREIQNVESAIRTANRIRVSNILEKNERHYQQTMAYASLGALLSFVEHLYNAKYITESQTEYWTGLIDNASKLVYNWRKSDESRYKNIT